MNTPPIIKEDRARPLTKFLWNRIREFIEPSKSRGKDASFMIVFGYAALALADDKETQKAYNDDDAFFDLIAKVGINLTEEEEDEIGTYINGVIKRWEAAQIEVDGAGKTESTEETRQPTTTI
jgi:hypothetical protein